jgi:hypothetical protein
MSAAAILSRASFFNSRSLPNKPAPNFHGSFGYCSSPVFAKSTCKFYLHSRRKNKGKKYFVKSKKMAFQQACASVQINGHALLHFNPLFQSICNNRFYFIIFPTWPLFEWPLHTPPPRIEPNSVRPT